MAEFTHFCNKIKEEPTSEEEGEDECELVACSALLQGAIKEEPDSGFKTSKEPKIIQSGIP